MEDPPAVHGDACASPVQAGVALQPPRVAQPLETTSTAHEEPAHEQALEPPAPPRDELATVGAAALAVHSGRPRR